MRACVLALFFFLQFCCLVCLRGVAAQIQEEGGKSFNVYVLLVNFTSPAGETMTWEVHRRYSEFDDFHTLVR